MTADSENISDRMKAAAFSGSGGMEPSGLPDGGMEEAADPALSGLAIGSLTLNPAFEAETTEYTAETANNTNKVTALPTDEGANVAIYINGETLANGAAAAWKEGENTLLAVVSSENKYKAYKVTVTKV